MNSTNTAFVIAQAEADRPKHPFARAVRGAIEVGVIVPSILAKNLRDQGYGIVNDTTTLKEYGFGDTKVLQRVLVNDAEGTIVAMGASFDTNDALLHAALGWFRENAVALPDIEVPVGVAQRVN